MTEVVAAFDPAGPNIGFDRFAELIRAEDFDGLHAFTTTSTLVSHLSGEFGAGSETFLDHAEFVELVDKRLLAVDVFPMIHGVEHHRGVMEVRPDAVISLQRLGIRPRPWKTRDVEEGRRVFVVAGRDRARHVLRASRLVPVGGPEAGAVRCEHFVDEGDPIRSLLLDFRKAGIKQPRRGNLDLISYVDQLLATFSPPRIMQSSKWYESEARPAIDKLAVSEPLIETLSQRELEILRLLQTELSVPEIAGELVIAPSTVRTHTKSIYSKLDVNNRRAAVKRASELNLI